MITFASEMDIKRIYRQFRVWQRKPFRYVNRSKGKTTCHNCGTEYDGNFCPVCGQRAGVGRIGWKSVQQGVMLLWGMDSRSLSYTLFQLLFRPGHLISDYINGKRQVSFPPVKMLFIVAIGYILTQSVQRAFFPGYTTEMKKEDFEQGWEFLYNFTVWFDSNVGWGTLLFTALFILPTWLLYRCAPHHRHHTLPEGFFIQVFMATIMIMISIPAELFRWIAYLLPVYYMIAYKQLFGYGWWGTLWRYVVCCVLAFVQMIILSGIAYHFLSHTP